MGKKSILTTRDITEQLLIHPSDLSEKKFKRSIAKQMKNRVGKWDTKRQAILTAYKDKFRVLKNGRGHIVDMCTPYVQYTVKTTGEFATPTIGQHLCK